MVKAETIKVRRILALCAVMLIAIGRPSPLFAQSGQEGEIVEPKALISSFDISTMSDFLNELGLRYKKRNQNGYAVLIADIGVDGTTTVFWPRVCDEKRTNCSGLIMRTYFENASQLELNNRFNLTTPPVAAMTDGSSVFVQRYLIGDFGITRGSLAVNIVVFQSTVRKFKETLESAPTTTVAFGARSPEADAPAKILNGNSRIPDQHINIGEGIFLFPPQR
ncbi:MAG: hypothetical protein AAF720_06605 [Pseudomonadota bacterium]